MRYEQYEQKFQEDLQDAIRYSDPIPNMTARYLCDCIMHMLCFAARADVRFGAFIEDDGRINITAQNDNHRYDFKISQDGSDQHMIIT